MKTDDPVSNPGSVLQLANPSAALLSAALGGLLCLASPACESPSGDNTQAEPAGDPRVISKEKVPEMTYTKFSADCLERGGFVQTHASCSGNNSCKGISFNKFSSTRVEHTCKGLNTCGGLSCVVLPVDQGRSGQELYAETCGHCHGDKGTFELHVPPDTDLVRAESDFTNRSPDTLATIVAFGTRGVNTNGTAFANMPAHFEKISRAEIGRVVDYLRTLPVKAKAYGIVGVTEELGPKKL